MNISQSLSITERSKLNKNFNDLYVDREIESFFENNKVLNDNDIKEMLNIYYGGKKFFLKGISLDEKTLESKNSFVWENFIADNIERNLIKGSAEKFKFWYPLRFLINVEKNNINKILSENNHFVFSESTVENCLKNLMDSLTMIISQPIILDLHKYKENHELHENETLAFYQYLNNRFFSIEDNLNFYDVYPNLKRIIYEKIIHFEDNLKELVSNMDSNLTDFLKEIKLESKEIISIHFNEEETHEKGKSVAIITFSNDDKIVYKPKDLNILKGLENIFEYFNKNIGPYFYNTKKYIGDNYIFEEYITSSGVKRKEEINQFYFNYGTLVGFSYIFKCSDLHSENIIAYGKYPVLIDLETILQQDIPVLQGHGDLSIQQNLLYSLLLPSNNLMKSNKNNQSHFDISGLSSGIQYTPFNTLQITNWGSSNMKFEYKKAEIQPSQNVPFYRNEKINYLNYKQDILNGFEKFMHYVLENKNEISNLIRQNLSDEIARIVLRDTSKYVRLLNYSYHPKCLKNSIEREKVLQNLWAYDFIDKTIIKYEMNDMLKGDVPTFYINTSKKHLLSSNKEYIYNIFEEPSINLVLKRIEKLTDSLINEQSKTILNLL